MIKSKRNSAIESWDYEFNVISGDLNAIKNYQHDSAHRERIALVGLRLNVLNLQGRLAALLDRLQTLTAQLELVSGSTRALIHWSGIFAQKCREFYTVKASTLGKEMWLRLLRTRVTGTSSSRIEDSFSDENLIEIALRFQQMSKVHDQLEAHVADLRSQQDHLRFRYEDVRTAQANREAAGSLYSNFGRSLSEARDHPTLSRVSRVFRHLSRGTKPLAHRYRYLNELHHGVSTQTERLIQNCKSIVLGNLHDKSHQRIQNRELEASLREIEQLREQLNIAAEICDAAPMPARPHIVSKSS